MIKLISLLNEIRVKSNKITPKEVYDLWYIVDDPYYYEKDEARKWQKLQIHLDWLSWGADVSHHDTLKWLKTLDQTQLSKYYKELESYYNEFEDLDEIKVQGTNLTHLEKFLNDNKEETLTLLDRYLEFEEKNVPLSDWRFEIKDNKNVVLIIKTEEGSYETGFAFHNDKNKLEDEYFEIFDTPLYIKNKKIYLASYYP